jgi:hypothetical protein
MIQSKLNIIQLRIILICGKFDDSTKIYDKRDDFNFKIINVPNMCSNKNPTGRRASVREFITRQTCKICDYTVDCMCPTKTSKSPRAFVMCSIRTDLLK